MTINEVAAKQDQNSNQSSLQSMAYYGVNTFNLKDYTPEGSPYFENSWFTGEIVMHDGKTVDEYAFKYHVVNNAIVINIDNQIYSLPEGVFKSFKTETITANGVKNVKSFKRAVIDKKIKYLEEIVSSGNLSLMKQHIKKFVKSNYNAALDVGNHKDRFMNKEMLYLKINDDYIEIKGSRKKILKQIQNRKLKKFISNNDLNIKDVKDLNFLVANFNL